MLKFPVSQPYDKPEQPQLLPGRKPITQIAQRFTLQQSQKITQSKTRLKMSTPESSIFLGKTGHHDKVIPVPDYTVPLCQSMIQFLEQ